MPTSWPARLLLGLVLLVVLVGGVVAVRVMTANPSPEAATPPVTETPTASESATPGERRYAQPKRFGVELVSIKGEAIDGSNMFGRRPDRRRPVVRNASKFAAEQLERYLNEMFVDRDTRFTAEPLRPLLTENARKALTDRARRALGAEGPEILGGKTVSAKARSVVLYRNSQPYLVTLRYTAKMNIIQAQDEKPQRMEQTGTMVFKKMGSGGWRADLADVRLSLPEPPKPKPQPQPSEETSP